MGRSKEYDYPLSGVTITHTEHLKAIENPLYSGSNWKAGENEFFLQVNGVGSFSASNGRDVTYTTTPGADPEWVRLYLNGQVLVALLHQRGIINFHASSFIYNDRGIMVMGETGAGKSSLTASFILEGAGYLTDDLTPVVFRETQPLIKPLNRPLKLRGNTVEQLNLMNHNLTEAETGTGKHYLHIKHASVEDYPINTIFIIEVGDVKTPEFYTPELPVRFSLLRSEVCSWEILTGMPVTEAEYLEKLLQIVEKASIVKILRPEQIGIAVLQAAIIDYLEMHP